VIKETFNNVRAKVMRQILRILLLITMLTPIAGFSQTELESLKAKAEQGDADAQYDLGNMYSNGRGVPQNYTEAVKWFRLSAEQGDASGQASLGAMYDMGYGVPQNYTEAAKWHRLAAEQGLAIAQISLGLMYDMGEGIPQDGVMAYVWLSLAAAQGFETARYHRDISAKQLTPEQLARGQDIAARCFASGYKDCT